MHNGIRGSCCDLLCDIIDFSEKNHCLPASERFSCNISIIEGQMIALFNSKILDERQALMMYLGAVLLYQCSMGFVESATLNRFVKLLVMEDHFRLATRASSSQI
jgi:hypothetical protein